MHYAAPSLPVARPSRHCQQPSVMHYRRSVNGVPLETAKASPAPSAFDTTRWTIVARAAGHDEVSRQALADLCQNYWLPLYVYVRRRGYSAHDAEDLTQGFFSDLLSRGAIRRADPARGRFRSFLLTALTNYLHNAHDHANAARRGGGVERVSIDNAAATGVLDQIESEALAPDRAFDRSWALALFDRALRRLRTEQDRAGKARWFQRLSPLLQGRPETGEYDAIAVEFRVSRNAVAVAVHRLAARYRELVRAEIADTVSSPEEFDHELRELLASLRR